MDTSDLQSIISVLEGLFDIHEVKENESLRKNLLLVRIKVSSHIEKVKNQEKKSAVVNDASQQKESVRLQYERLLGDKEAELTRVRGEIERLRGTISRMASQKEEESEEVRNLERQLKEALDLNKEAQRSAISSTTSAAEGQGFEFMKLQSELGVFRSLTSRLEADLASQTEASNARAAEIQSTFAAKLADTRGRYEEQILRIQSDLDQALQTLEQVRAAQSRDKEGGGGGKEQKEIAEKPNKMGGQTQSNDNHSQMQIQQLLLKTRELTAQNADLKKAASEWEGRVKRSEIRAQEAAAAAQEATVRETQLQQQLTSLSSMNSSNNDRNNEEKDRQLASMVSLMEGQLGRLSEVIRRRESELSEVQQTLQSTLLERRELYDKLNQQQTFIEQLQMQMQQMHLQRPGPPAMGGGRGNQGGGGGEVEGGGGVGGPLSASGSVGSSIGVPTRQRMSTPISPSRPHRSGLHSKPRFR